MNFFQGSKDISLSTKFQPNPLIIDNSLNLIAQSHANYLSQKNAGLLHSSQKVLGEKLYYFNKGVAPNPYEIIKGFTEEAKLYELKEGKLSGVSNFNRSSTQTYNGKLGFGMSQAADGSWYVCINYTPCLASYPMMNLISKEPTKTDRKQVSFRNQSTDFNRETMKKFGNLSLDSDRESLKKFDMELAKSMIEDALNKERESVEKKINSLRADLKTSQAEAAEQIERNQRICLQRFDSTDSEVKSLKNSLERTEKCISQINENQKSVSVMVALIAHKIVPESLHMPELKHLVDKTPLKVGTAGNLLVKNKTITSDEQK